MAVQNKVSLPVIKRLPKYYRYLTNLSADGKDKISSSELAHMMGTTASQVRQDFNCFGGFGQQGIGYKVDVLRAEIGNLLFGDGEKLPTILVGAGRLGSAVSSFISRDANGYKLLGVFDVNPDLIGKEMCGVPILPLCGASPRGGRALRAAPERHGSGRGTGDPGHQGLLEFQPLRSVRGVSRRHSGERPPWRQSDEPGVPAAEPGEVILAFLGETDSPDTGGGGVPAPEGERCPEGAEGASFAAILTIPGHGKALSPTVRGRSPLPEGAKKAR